MKTNVVPGSRACGVALRTGAAVLLLAAGSAIAQVDAARATEPPERFDGERVVRVDIRSTRDLRTALALTDDVWSDSIRRAGPVDIRVSPAQFAALATSGLKFRVMIGDLQQRIEQETAAVRARALVDDAAWYTNYHNYTENKAYCQALAAAYPGLAQYVVLGQSVQGRDIFGIRVTGPGSTAGRPAGIWWGGQHAREWVTVPLPEYCAEQLLTRYATDAHIQSRVNSVEFIFVPIMNPDGYDYTWTNNRLWRKNRHAGIAGCGSSVGVDLNRNWGFQWGGEGASTACNNDTYRGPSAFSEAETQVMRNFVQANPRIRSTMDFHSYGQLVMSPWGYTAALPAPASVAQEFQALDDAMAAAIFSVHGKTYEAGPVYTTIYPASGTSVDWAFGAQGIKGLTTELRDLGGQNGFGFLLPADQITPTAEENFAAFLVLADAIAPPPACYANCDASTASPVLNVADFTCFLQKYSSGDAYANCDASTQAPALNVSDFTCFLQKYSGGCP